MTKLLKAGTIEKPIKLNNIMTDIVDKNLSQYKNDVNIDFEIITETFKNTDNFIWIVRDLGTWILEENELYVENSNADIVFEFCIKNNQIKKLYKITITKRIKSRNIYGIITELNKKSFLKSLNKSNIQHN